MTTGAGERTLQTLHLSVAALAVLAPAAHVLELPNKLALDGPLWLAVQQHLYRGWGPFIGAPLEIGALVLSAAMAVLCRRDTRVAWAAAVAAAAYAGMIATFLAFNASVNGVVSHVTTTSLPPDWPLLRRQWETGHAIAAALAVIALAAAVRAWSIRHRSNGRLTAAKTPCKEG